MKFKEKKTKQSKVSVNKNSAVNIHGEDKLEKGQLSTSALKSLINVTNLLRVVQR